jgi:hypothetical protein
MKTCEEENPVSDNFFEKGNPIIEIISTLLLWVKKPIESFIKMIRSVGLSSVAQWCIILVMLYLTLAG